MKANQESLMKDRRGRSDIGVILIIIAIAFVVVACGLILLFVATPHLLDFQHSIGIPENSQLPTAADFASSIGCWLLIAGIGILVVILLIWYLLRVKNYE